MSKSLEALIDLSQQNKVSLTEERRIECYKLIEKELKECEKLKSMKLLPYPKVNDKEYRQNVIKRLLSLEIIKEKPRTLFLVQTCENYDTYSALAQDIALIEDIYSPKEYVLLKEVLL